MSRPNRRPLTERELEIVHAVGRFRVLSGRQLQVVFFPTGTLVGTRRRTQSTLKRLVDESYLARLERRVGGERAGSASFCYCLGPRGQRLLAPSRRGRRPAEPGLSFVRHHLAVADVWVSATETQRAGGPELVEVQAEPECWRLTPKSFGGSEWVKPDLFLSLGVGEYEWRWFIEVDLATESLRRVERTCERYVAHYRSGVEQAEHEVFPRVAWLTPSPRRADGIADVIAGRSIEERDLFVVGLLEQSNRILKGGDHERTERSA